MCDAFFFRGKDVAVIGDGNYAVHEAEILKPIAKSVRIITNGKRMVQNRNIDVETIKDSVKEVKGKDILEEIEFANGKTIKIDGVFVAEGIATSTDLAKRIGALVEGNNIKINENMETSVKGLYACGDCTGGILQISKAVYEGAKAGLEIIKKEDKNVSNFEKEVNNSQMPVLIDFWASWCGPCKMMSPVIDEIANETQETLKVCKVNVDDELELARKFNIMSIPTFVAIKEGKVIGTTVGVQTKQQILDLLK